MLTQLFSLIPLHLTSSPLSTLPFTISVKCSSPLPLQLSHQSLSWSHLGASMTPPPPHTGALGFFEPLNSTFICSASFAHILYPSLCCCHHSTHMALMLPQGWLYSQQIHLPSSSSSIFLIRLLCFQIFCFNRSHPSPTLLHQPTQQPPCTAPSLLLPPHPCTFQSQLELSW